MKIRKWAYDKQHLYSTLGPMESVHHTIRVDGYIGAVSREVKGKQ